MVRLRAADFKKVLPKDEKVCLEWLKDKLYPKGIECQVCNKVTKHHKVSNRHCYVCGSCGNHFYPTSGTIFQKSNTPLNIWFNVIHHMQSSDRVVSARDVQREYHLSYKRSHYLVKKIKEFLDEDRINAINGSHPDETNADFPKKIFKYPEAGRRSKIIPTDNFSRLKDIHNFEDADKNNTHKKNDRIARLLKLQMLLAQNSEGFRIEEISQKLAVSNKTIYRDLKTLELNLNVPLWEERGRRGIVEGYFLPPINFTIGDAMNIFLAARMVQQLTHEYNPSIISTYIKLNAIVPESLKNHINFVIQYLEKQPKDERARSNFDKLTQAWLLHQTIKTYYQESYDSPPVEYLIDPYFIEPMPFLHSFFLIGYCHSKKSVKVFKMDQIVRDIIVEPDVFTIPSDFNPVEYLGSAWGVLGDDEILTVKLHVKTKTDEFLPVVTFNSSQYQSEVQKDGTKIVTLKVRDVSRFCRWIIRFYDEVVVLEPEFMQDQIRKVANDLLNLYPQPERNSAIN
jgi:predicted DNA-binding transcriptional regulator YafY